MTHTLFINPFIKLINRKNLNRKFSWNNRKSFATRKRNNFLKVLRKKKCSTVSVKGAVNSHIELSIKGSRYKRFNIRSIYAQNYPEILSKGVSLDRQENYCYEKKFVAVRQRLGDWNLWLDFGHKTFFFTHAPGENYLSKHLQASL